MAVVRKIVRLRFFLALVLTSIIIIFFIVFKNAYVRRKVEEYSFLKFENQTMRKTIANLFKCENNYMTLNESDYSKEADKTLHNMRIVRGLILYSKNFDGYIVVGLKCKNMSLNSGELI